MAEVEPINVLIVEDDIIPAFYLKEIIEENEGFRVVGIARRAKEAEEFLDREKIDLIFMDIVLEGQKSGAEFALEVKQKYKDIDIIFLTAYGDDEIVEYAIESKAFAYLLKPYRVDEIKATLKLFKAQKKDSSASSLILELVDGFSYNKQTKRLYKDNKEVKLSALELKLIQILCENHNITLSRESLAYKLNLKENALRTLIYRLRHHTSVNLIQSIKRFGYKIALKEN